MTWGNGHAGSRNLTILNSISKRDVGVSAPTHVANSSETRVDRFSRVDDSMDRSPRYRKSQLAVAVVAMVTRQMDVQVDEAW